MPTVLDLINGAMRILGVKSEGNQLTAQQTSEALELLNQMLEAWSLDELLVYTVNRDVYTLTPGTQLYTLGPGGTMAPVRPNEIKMVSVIPVGGSYPLEIPVHLNNDEQWRNVTVKTVPSTFPVECWDNGNYPLRGLNFWPIPTTACQVVLYTWAVLGGFSSVSQELSLPPGYAQAIRLSLAVQLAPDYGLIQQATPIGFAAMQARALLKDRNREIEYTLTDWATGGSGQSIQAIKSRGYVID